MGNLAFSPQLGDEIEVGKNNAPRNAFYMEEANSFQETVQQDIELHDCKSHIFQTKHQ